MHFVHNMQTVAERTNTYFKCMSSVSKDHLILSYVLPWHMYAHSVTMPAFTAYHNCASNTKVSTEKKGKKQNKLHGIPHPRLCKAEVPRT